MSEVRFKFDSSGCATSLHSAMAKQWPLFGKGHPVTYWAENGLVKYIDERPDLAEHEKYGAMSWQTAAKRVLGVSAMVINSSETPGWAHERRMLQKFISEMEEVLRQAKEQGGPFDGDTTLRDRARRRRKTVIMPTIIEGDDF